MGSLAARAEAAAERGQWADAYAFYQAARATTQDAVTRRDLQLNLGVCLMGLGRSVDAIEAFETFVAEGGEQSAVEELLSQASEAVGILELEVSPTDAQLFVDGVLHRAVGAERRIALAPGRHRIEVRGEGYVEQAIAVTARPGASVAMQFELVAQAATIAPPAIEPEEPTSPPTPASEPPSALSTPVADSPTAAESMPAFMFPGGVALVAAGGVALAFAIGLHVHRESLVEHYNDDSPAGSCSILGETHRMACGSVASNIDALDAAVPTMYVLSAVLAAVGLAGLILGSTATDHGDVAWSCAPSALGMFCDGRF